MQPKSSLTNLQLELLRLFAMELSPEQLEDIKRMLNEYLGKQLTLQMDKLFEKNQWGEEKIEAWANEHMRTKYEEE